MATARESVFLNFMQETSVGRSVGRGLCSQVAAFGSFRTYVGLLWYNFAAKRPNYLPTQLPSAASGRKTYLPTYLPIRRPPRKNLPTYLPTVPKVAWSDAPNK